MPSGLRNPEYPLLIRSPNRDEPVPVQADIEAQKPDILEQALVIAGQVKSGIDHDK